MYGIIESNHMKKLFTILCLLVLASCADARFYAVGYVDQVIHPANPKVFTIRISKSCGQVGEWVRLSDVNKVVLVCDTDCNCKLVKGPQPVSTEVGICR